MLLRRYPPFMASFRLPTVVPDYQTGEHYLIRFWRKTAPSHLAMTGFHHGLRPTLKLYSHFGAPHTFSSFTRLTRKQLSWSLLLQGIASRPPRKYSTPFEVSTSIGFVCSRKWHFRNKSEAPPLVKFLPCDLNFFLGSQDT